jgi:hypothetical protein
MLGRSVHPFGYVTLLGCAGQAVGFLRDWPVRSFGSKAFSVLRARLAHSSWWKSGLGNRYTVIEFSRLYRYDDKFPYSFSYLAVIWYPIRQALVSDPSSLGIRYSKFGYPIRQALVSNTIHRFRWYPIRQVENPPFCGKGI